MIKGLLLSCLLSASVSNTTPPLSPVLEPSRAISSSSFSEGEFYRFDYHFVFGSQPSTLSLNDDGLVNLLSVNYPNDLEIYIGCAVSLPIEVAYFEIYLTNILDLDESYQQFLYFEDNVYYWGTSYGVATNDDELEFDVSFTFECATDGIFSEDSLSYLTKIENPYTPPAKSNLYRLLYDFYYSLFNDDDLSAISTSYNMPFDNWLAHTCTIATLLLLIVVAFFFLRWLFKTVSGLILLRH